MKTDTQIRRDLFRYLKGTDLASAVNGQLKIDERPDTSDKEDVVISVIGNVNAQIQQAYVNVNIYVPDVKRGTQYIENTIRTDELGAIAAEVLDSGYGDGFRFSLEEQHVMKVSGRNEHFINNKLLYKFCKA